MFEFAGRGFFYPEYQDLFYDMITYIISFIIGCFFHKVFCKTEKLKLTDAVSDKQYNLTNIKLLEPV